MTGILNKFKTEDSKLSSQDNKNLQIGSKTGASPPSLSQDKKLLQIGSKTGASPPPNKINDTEGTPMH